MIVQTQVPAGLLARVGWVFASIAVCLALFALILLSGGVLVYVTHHDLWFMLDAIHRTAEAQIPHVDFHTPIGQAFYWPFAILAWQGQTSPRAILYAEVLIGAVLLCLSVLTLRSRLSGPLLLSAICLIVVSAITPRKLGRTHDVLSHLALYNQWGFAFLTVIALIVLVPPRQNTDRRHDDAVAGVTVGVGLSYLSLLKITYFVGGVGLLGVALILGSARIRLASFAVPTFFFIILAVALAGANLGAYIFDLRLAVAAGAGERSFDELKLVKFAAEGTAYGALTIAIVWLSRPVIQLFQWLRLWWKELLAGAILIAGGVALSVQNNPESECPLFIAAVILVAELARRKVYGNTAQANRATNVARNLLIFSIAAYYIATDARSILTHTIVTNSGGACRLTSLQDTAGADLMFPPQALTTASRVRGDIWGVCESQTTVALRDWESRYLVENQELVSEGITLLRRHAQQGDKVFAFDFANPFPYLLGTPSPRGALVWWDPGRTFSDTSHPNPKRLFSNVDLILIPHPGRMADYAAEMMRRIYGSAVTRDFKVVDRGAVWTLWRRTRQPT